MALNANPKTITLNVTTTRGSASFTCLKTDKVSDLIQKVREHFELTGDGQFTLIRDSNGEELTPQTRTLVSFGLQDGEGLTLTGGGTNV